MSTPTTSLTCRELVELVTDYIEGMLPEPERVRVEGHVDCCAWCVAYIGQMRQTIEVVGQVEIEPGPVAADTEQQLLAVFRDWKTGRV
jgi:hypothetical protein